MKKFYSFLAIILFATLTYSQLTIATTPSGSTTIKITYGASGDYSLYNPNFASTIWLHTWINGGENSTGNSFTDDWFNSTEKLDWSATENAYVGYINLATHAFTQGTLPVNTTVTNYNLILKSAQNGGSQSANLSGGSYGFTTISTAVLGVDDIASLKTKSVVSEGKLYTVKKGNLNLQVLDFSGRVIKNLNVKADGNPIELNLSKKGNYLLKISNDKQNEVLKFAY